MEKGLFLRIKNYESYATPSELDFIRYLNTNPEQLVGKGLKEVAQLTYSSQATVYRLCRKLDFDGYKEFQSALVYELALMKESQVVSMQDIDPGQSTADVIKRVTWKNVESLEMSSKLVKPKDIETCVDL
ncbi:MAG: MurR/RpiR family transcriptional regulator, partial [Pseudobutyrivibrio sp.]|nr:MurR/RpiR family transcriptional regulator [Pseudobutyrivibrio sp.]